MTVLLDTVAFIRHMQGALPLRTFRLLDRSTTDILVSVVTPWEIATKPALRKAKLDAQKVRKHLEILGSRLLSITLEHTERLYELSMHHSDPFDRMIIAQALVEDCPLVSSDQRFPLYASEGLKVFWDD